MAPRHLQQASTTQDRSLPFQIRGTNLTLLTLKLTDPTAPDFFERLAASLSIAPGFYHDAPIILDLTGVTDLAPVDLVDFCARLCDLALAPVGFVGATADWEQAALAAGLSVFPAGRATDGGATKGRAAPLPRRATARVISEPVRSGQQVYAPHADLIVMAPVSRGAELMADGNIHVYGRLRGRALAGMNGDGSARIFCRELDADLVSIAGFYMVSEQMDPQLIGKSVQIRLDGERLVFEPL